MKILIKTMMNKRKQNNYQTRQYLKNILSLNKTKTICSINDKVKSFQENKINNIIK